MSDWLTYGGLSRQDFGKRLAWFRAPAIIVLHSTEGGSYPGYGGGASAPHFTIDCRARTARQHHPLSSAARALRASSSGHTNTGGAVQIEVIGTCVVGGNPSVLNLDDGALGYLAGLLRVISSATGIPLTTSVRWSSYPASYGAWAGRLGWAAWAGYRGVLGHQHVPGNSHGDPGSMNIPRLLELASGKTPPPEDDMYEPADRARDAEILQLLKEQQWRNDRVIKAALASDEPIDYLALATAVVALLPTGDEVTADAVADILAARLTS